MYIRFKNILKLLPSFYLLGLPFGFHQYASRLTINFLPKDFNHITAELNLEFVTKLSIIRHKQAYKQSLIQNLK